MPAKAVTSDPMKSVVAAFFLLPIGAHSAAGQSLLLQKALTQAEKDVRIVQGTPVPLTERPWQVGLVASAKANDLQALFCGGVLVAPSWVLTAAHCVDNGTQESQVQVLFGTNSLSGTGDRIGVAKIVLFDGYEATPKGVPITGDAALLKLDGAVRSMTTATLATVQDLEKAKKVTVSGWGRIQFDGVKSVELLQVELDIVSNGDCNDVLSWNNSVRDDMFCANADGSAACRGDSGGPATIRRPNGDIALAGLVSWGHKKCNVPKKYNVFQRLPAVTEFIEKTTGLHFHQ